MPIKVSKKAWTKWESSIQKLWKEFEFPANTRDSLSGFFSLFRGEGSCFRLETSSWKMVLDVIRTSNKFVDIIAITLASKLDLESNVRGGWVITTRCPVHPLPESPLQKSPTRTSSDESDIFWYKIEEGGRVSTHCCIQECAGPFKPGTCKVFDSARQGIVIKTLEHEVLRLRSSDKSGKLKEKGEKGSELEALVASITREKEEAQANYESMNGVHTEQAHDLIEIRAKNQYLVTRLAKVDSELSETKAKLAVMQTRNDEMQHDLNQAKEKFRRSDMACGGIRKQFDYTKKQESTLKIRLHEALQEIKTLKAGHHDGADNPLRYQTEPQEATPSPASNDPLVSAGNARRSQSLSIRSRPRVEIVDLISEAGQEDSTSKVPGDSQDEKESESEVPGSCSSSKKQRRKRKRDAQSMAPNDEETNDTPRKRRSSRSRRHGSKIKAEPEA